MKKALCLAGIFVLLYLAFLPPALRIILPDKKDDNIEEEVKQQFLICKSNRFTISTSYDDKKVTKIVFKRFKLLSDNNTEDENNNQVVIDNNTPLDMTFDDIKTDEKIVYNEQEDGEVISIDFDIYDHKELDLRLLNNSLDEEKSYYESQGLTCIVK